jgi:hypothetical protein
MVNNKLPWWRKDKLGWPIAKFPGRPFLSFISIIVQNVKKLF